MAMGAAQPSERRSRVMAAQSCHTCTVSVECQRICMHRHRIVRVGATGARSDVRRSMTSCETRTLHLRAI